MKFFYSIILLSILVLVAAVHNSAAQTDSVLYTDSAALTGSTDSTGDIYSLQGNDDTEVIETVVQEESRYEGTERVKKIRYRTFEFYLFLMILLAFGALRLFSPGIYSDLFKRFLNTSISIRPVKNIFQQIRLSNYILVLLFFLIGGLFLYYILDGLDLHASFIVDHPVWLQMLFYIGCISITYVVKLSFLGLIGYIFDMKRFTSEYAFNVLLIQQVLGIILYPFLWMIVFMGENVIKVAIIIAVILLFFAFLNRYARSRESITSLLKLNKFHFFIYLCTSEIIPLLIIVKIMIG